jgi:YD repeat-containing protein
LKKSTFRRAAAALAATVFALCANTTPRARQGGPTRYVYDDNGRLQAVIAHSGEAAVYEYDAAGNITAVRRLAATALALLDFSPRAGVPGDLVTLVGVGFGAGVTGVSFNGARARVVGATQSTLVAEVPQGATTGPISVTTDTASAITPRAFKVRGVRLSPPAPLLLFGEGIRFDASVVTEGDPALTWSVNDLAGGNGSSGTVSPGGLYTAPRATGTFVVRAALTSDPDSYGEALVGVRDPDAVGELRASLSVGRGFADGTGLVGNAVSVGRGNAGGVGTSSSAPTSVSYGGPAGQVTAAGSVSATKGPYVESVAPASIARGAAVTLTLKGANLYGASAIRFVNSSGAPAAGLTVTNIGVDADGVVLTATLNVSGSAATGQYVLSVITPAGDSGGNLLQIKLAGT